MIKFSSISRSPATAAAGSGVLILTAIVGLILAAGSAATPADGSAQPSISATLHAAPAALPKPCIAVRHHQPCGSAAGKAGSAKQMRKHAAQQGGIAAPPPAAAPTNNPTSP